MFIAFSRKDEETFFNQALLRVDKQIATINSTLGETKTEQRYIKSFRYIKTLHRETCFIKSFFSVGGGEGLGFYELLYKALVFGYTFKKSGIKKQNNS